MSSEKNTSKVHKIINNRFTRLVEHDCRAAGTSWHNCLCFIPSYLNKIKDLKIEIYFSFQIYHAKVVDMLSSY